MSELDFENPHYCPVYDKVIDIDLCYETLTVSYTHLTLPTN